MHQRIIYLRWVHYVQKKRENINIRVEGKCGIPGMKYYVLGSAIMLCCGNIYYKIDRWCSVRSFTPLDQDWGACATQSVRNFV